MVHDMACVAWHGQPPSHPTNSCCLPPACLPAELLEAPLAPRRTKQLETHGDVREDAYYWLRSDERDDPDVIAHLEVAPLCPLCPLCLLVLVPAGVGGRVEGWGAISARGAAGGWLTANGWEAWAGGPVRGPGKGPLRLAAGAEGSQEAAPCAVASTPTGRLGALPVPRRQRLRTARRYWLTRRSCRRGCTGR